MKQVSKNVWCVPLLLVILSAGGCAAFFDSKEPHLSALQRSLGCDVFEATFTPDGAVESVKLSNATIWPKVSSNRWVVVRDNELWAKSDCLSGNVLAKVCRERQLDSLSMIGVQVQPYSEWKNLSGSCVVELNIAGTNVDDSTSGFLSTLAALEVLDLTGTKCGDATVERLVELPELRTIRLNGTYLTDEGLVGLARCKNLETIEMGDTAVTEDGVRRYREAGGTAEVNQSRVLGGII